MSIITNALGFLLRQDKPFKVNLIKNIVMNFGIGLTQQYQSIYVIALGATALQLGYVTSLGGVVTMILSIPLGLIADRLGIKKMMTTALILLTLGYTAFALATEWTQTAYAYIFTAIGLLIGNNVCPMVCGTCLRSTERTTGMQFCDTAGAIPRLFAPIVAALIIAYYGGLNPTGIKPVFTLTAFIILAALLYFHKTFKNPTTAKQPDGTSLTKGLVRVFQEGVHVKRWLAYYTLMVMPWYLGFYLPLYARQVKNASPIALGLMDSGFWLIVLLLAIPVGLASDRLGRKKIILILTPFYCLGVLLLSLSNNEATIVIAGALTGFMMLSSVTESSLTVELVPRELLGSWFGLLGFFAGLLSFAGPILGSLIWEIQPTYVLLLLGASQIAKLAILQTMPSKTKYS
jgi:MFS family permease